MIYVVALGVTCSIVSALVCSLVIGKYLTSKYIDLAADQTKKYSDLALSQYEIALKSLSEAVGHTIDFFKDTQK